jgi:hypothetical protein
MQFLVYITVLMVSVSTVLLEIHWLTSPPPQPQPAVQTANATAPRPKVEGPNAALSPIYPTSPQASPTDKSAANAPPAEMPAGTSAAVETSAKAEPVQKPAAETTGVAVRADDTGEPAAGASVPTSSADRAPDSGAQTVSAGSNNRCNIQACSSAYKSFRESDCTYQPFEGPRRFCEKPPEAGRRLVREENTVPAARRLAKDTELRELRRMRQLDDDDADDIDEPEMLDERDRVLIIRRGSRW